MTNQALLSTWLNLGPFPDERSTSYTPFYVHQRSFEGVAPANAPFSVEVSRTDDASAIGHSVVLSARVFKGHGHSSLTRVEIGGCSRTLDASITRRLSADLRNEMSILQDDIIKIAENYARLHPEEMGLNRAISFSGLESRQWDERFNRERITLDRSTGAPGLSSECFSGDGISIDPSYFSRANTSCTSAPSQTSTSTSTSANTHNGTDNFLSTENLSRLLRDATIRNTSNYFHGYRNISISPEDLVKVEIRSVSSLEPGKISIGRMPSKWQDMDFLSDQEFYSKVFSSNPDNCPLEPKPPIPAPSASKPPCLPKNDQDPSTPWTQLSLPL